MYVRSILVLVWNAYSYWYAYNTRIKRVSYAYHTRIIRVSYASRLIRYTRAVLYIYKISYIDGTPLCPSPTISGKSNINCCTRVVGKAINGERSVCLLCFLQNWCTTFISTTRNWSLTKPSKKQKRYRRKSKVYCPFFLMVCWSFSVYILSCVLLKKIAKLLDEFLL